MILEEGDIVLTPYGEQSVVEVDHMRDWLLTQSPAGVIATWNLNDVEEPTMPADSDDHEALEAWLRIKATIVPSLQVEVDTVRCAEGRYDCHCAHCYRIIRKLSAVGTSTHYQITHYVDNEVCRCDLGTGEDCDCMSPVNLRWTRP